uniref:Uncharacterized protein n=1 Tax=Anopheles melas TaxID=34690 RepID=A0A182TWZ9_9DIPT
MWKLFKDLRLIGGLARRSSTVPHTNPTLCRSLSSTAQTNSEPFLSYEKDPAPAFLRDDVQQLLKSITRLELDKVFRKRSVKDNTVEYRFMTDEQLRRELLHSIEQAQQMLQMPPVVQEQQDSCRVISRDGALKSLSTSKFVFTDITYGLKNSQRSIVVRHPDGTLQEAPYEMRKRLNQIYFPLTGRSIHQPPMFEDEHLQRLLEEGKYEFVLDRACVQFEPYEKDYHHITAKVYQHINESRSFDALRSTRHFGPFVFFLDYLRNGIELIVLYSTLHGMPIDEGVKQIALQPQMPSLFDAVEKSVDELKQDEQYLSIIEKFVNGQATMKELNLAVQAYREMAAEKLRLAQGIRRMHGEC